MRGVEMLDDEADGESGNQDVDDLDEDEHLQNEAADFGFTNSASRPNWTESVVLEDEDEFELDEALIAGETDLDDESESENESDVDPETLANQDDEERRIRQRPCAGLKSSGHANQGPLQSYEWCWTCFYLPMSSFSSRAPRSAQGFACRTAASDHSKDTSATSSFTECVEQRSSGGLFRDLG